jgi:hypothetical protein
MSVGMSITRQSQCSTLGKTTDYESIAHVIGLLVMHNKYLGFRRPRRGRGSRFALNLDFVEGSDPPKILVTKG